MERPRSRISSLSSKESLEETIVKQYKDGLEKRKHSSKENL